MLTKDDEILCCNCKQSLPGDIPAHYDQDYKGGNLYFCDTCWLEYKDWMISSIKGFLNFSKAPKITTDQWVIKASDLPSHYLITVVSEGEMKNICSCGDEYCDCLDILLEENEKKESNVK